MTSKALNFEMEEKDSNDMDASPINQLVLNPMIFHQRFSHISEQIFEKLDEKNLKICREIAKPWQDCIDNKNILWNRIAKKSGWAKTLQSACKNGHFKMAKMLVQKATEYKINLNGKYKHDLTLFHLACYNGVIL